MGTLSKEQLIAGLRASIAAVEQRPPLAGADPGSGPTEAARQVPMFGPMPGQLHEVFTDERRNGGAALGFALGLAASQLSPRRPALFFLQLAHAGQEAGLPYGPGLASFGVDPGRLVIGRTETLADLLWALEEALACGAVAAIVADLGGAQKGPDFSASRRLSLRAAAGGGSALLLRYGRGREASAARLRWHVAPAPSGRTRFDALEPGETRWRVQLEKGAVAGKRNGAWLLGWTENGFEFVDNRMGGKGVPPRPKALPGALSAQLADRLPQTG